MGTLYDITGISAAKEARKTAKQGQGQLDWQRQLFDQYFAPYMQAGLKQLPGQEQNYNTLMGYLQNMMGGKTQGLPSFLQPTDTSGLEQGLGTLSRQGLGNASNAMRGDLSQWYAGQGTPISQQQAGLMPRFQTNFMDLLSQENARKAMTMYDVNQQNKQGQLGNFFNLLGTTQGLNINPTQYAQTGMNMAGQNADYYNQLAQTYGNMSGGMMGGLGGILGTLWGGGGLGGMFGGGNKSSTGGAIGNYDLYGNRNNTGMGLGNLNLGKPWQWNTGGGTSGG